MSNEATNQQIKPQGTGRDIVKLVAEDFITLPLTLPGRGLETFYQWSRSIAFELKMQINGELNSWGRNLGPEIIADLEARAALGEKKYGERLKAFNGRDALVDAYQEALDLCNYLRQKLEELEINK